MSRVSAFWRSYRAVYSKPVRVPSAVESISELDQAHAAAINEARASLADASRSLVAHRAASRYLASQGVLRG